VPPPATPHAATPVDQAVSSALAGPLQSAQAAAAAAQKAAKTAVATLGKLQAQQAQLQQQFRSLNADDAVAADKLSARRAAMRSRAVALYVDGPSLPAMPIGEDLEGFGRRAVLVEALQDADRRALTGYQQAKAAAGSQLDALVAKLEQLNGQVQAAQAAATNASNVVQGASASVGAVRSTTAVAVNGFVFPVAEPHSFTDTFGAPRMTGTPYAHTHQGNDIFTPYGNPLYACERGYVDRMGTDRLGGTKLWIIGASGTRYYYAHLSAFAAGISDGTLVEAGTIVGFAGNTGNAATTPTHLHFEIHPGGGPAIDPYAILKAADDATRRFNLEPTTTGADTTPTLPAANP
jgi:murein DD-endopeptidase MepM/ murein hydrolase activator NlpD